jgi:hypothetical protein
MTLARPFYQEIDQAATMDYRYIIIDTIYALLKNYYTLTLY